MEIQKQLLNKFGEFLKNSRVSEIIINDPGQFWVEIDGSFLCVKDESITEYYLKQLFQVIANSNKQELNSKNPLLSGSLHDGSRIQLVIPPVSQFHSMAIRRKKVTNMLLLDHFPENFFKFKKKDIEQDTQLTKLYAERNFKEFLALAVKTKKNIVVSGGTSTGKTTLLNALIQEIHSESRIISLEDTRELDLSNHLNSLSLIAKKGEGGSTPTQMVDLVQASLRLRPDRILLGEIRGKEILDFLGAASTGHEGSMTSIHADSTQRAFMRMKQLYKLNNVPSMRDENILEEIHDVVDVIVQLKKGACGRYISDIYYKGEK